MNTEKYVPKYPVIKVEFSKRLTALREEKGLKKGEFADMLSTNRKTYASWEDSGQTALPTDYNTLVSICEILDTDIQYLLTGLFGERRDDKHRQAYLNIYDRYKKDAEFHFIVKVMLTADKRLLGAVADLIEMVDESYRGPTPFDDF